MRREQPNGRRLSYHLKLVIILLIASPGLLACFKSGPKRFVIAESKSYETSIYRQHCAICHGPEGDGKTLDTGQIVPSLRTGEFKYKSLDEVQHHIAEGGNGMTPFKGQLTQRELQLMAEFVRRDLRGLQ